MQHHYKILIVEESQVSADPISVDSGTYIGKVEASTMSNAIDY